MPVALSTVFSSCPKSGDDSSASPEAEEAFEADGRRILGVLARLASSVPPEVATPLADKLLAMLLELVATPETSAAIVGALHKLCFAKVTCCVELRQGGVCWTWAVLGLVTGWLIDRLMNLRTDSGGIIVQYGGGNVC